MARKTTAGSPTKRQALDTARSTCGCRRTSALPAGRTTPKACCLRFTYDEERNCFVCRFRLGKRYTGPPGHCHGGIIATILDEAMGKVNKLRQVVALTSEITVNYLKPVPLNQAAARRVARGEGYRDGSISTLAEILNQKGEVLARGAGCLSRSIRRRCLPSLWRDRSRARSVSSPNSVHPMEM